MTEVWTEAALWAGAWRHAWTRNALKQAKWLKDTLRYHQAQKEDRQEGHQRGKKEAQEGMTHNQWGDSGREGVHTMRVVQADE